MSPPRHDADPPNVSERIAIAVALVPIIVQQLKAQLVAHAREDDLRSFGNEGALIAARTFDPKFGVPFRRWATLKVRGAILDGLRGCSDLPRRIYDRLRALDAMSQTQEALMEEDAASPATTPEGADARLGSYLASMATALGVGMLMQRDQEALEELEDSRGTPEEEMAREEAKARVRQAIAARPESERALIEGYYFRGLTLEQAGSAMGLSKSWACRLHARAIGALAEALRDPDPDD